MQTHTEQPETSKEIILIATISKSGNRLILGIPKRYETGVQALFGQPVRVTLEKLL